jgi:hypothetical protein
LALCQPELKMQQVLQTFWNFGFHIWCSLSGMIFVYRWKTQYKLTTMWVDIWRLNWLQLTGTFWYLCFPSLLFSSFLSVYVFFSILWRMVHVFSEPLTSIEIPFSSAFHWKWDSLGFRGF